LRARLVLDAGCGPFPSDGGKLGAPFAVRPIKKKDPFAWLEPEHGAKVMRLILAKRDLGAALKL
jgi:hypothetical protein